MIYQINFMNFCAKLSAAYFATKCYILLPIAPPELCWVGKRRKTGERRPAAGSCPSETAVSQKVNGIKMIKYQNRLSGFCSIYYSMYAFFVVFVKNCLDWITSTSLNEHTFTWALMEKMRCPKRRWFEEVTTKKKIRDTYISKRNFLKIPEF